jgi:hypothetical protein
MALILHAIAQKNDYLSMNLTTKTMRKIIFGLSIALIAFGVNSCGSTSGTGAQTFEFDITSGQWASSGTPGQADFLYYHSHSLSAITSTVVSSGAVLGYIQLGGGGGAQWAALPFTSTQSGWVTNYNFQYETGSVFIVRKDDDLNTIPPNYTISIKIVIVSQKNMPLLDGVDTHNYQAVSDVLRIEG